MSPEAKKIALHTLGRLWLRFEKCPLRIVVDQSSIYKWELYAGFVRITWLHKRKGFRGMGYWEFPRRQG